MRLEPDDVEAIAERVLALLRDELLQTPARLVDATALANALGVDRTWVYAHAASSMPSASAASTAGCGSTSSWSSGR